MANEALGLIETRGLVAAIEAADTMVKAGECLADWQRADWRRICYCNGFEAMLAQSKRQRTRARKPQKALVNSFLYMLSLVHTQTWKICFPRGEDSGIRYWAMEKVKPSPISYLQSINLTPRNRRYTWRKLTLNRIEEIVSQVINNLRSEGRISSAPVRSSKVGVGSRSQSGIHPSTDQAVVAAKQAQAEFVRLGFAKRREIIEAIKRAALENAQRLADLAVEDTGMGNAAHKLIKNEGRGQSFARGRRFAIRSLYR